MRLTIVQNDLIWQEPETNRGRFAEIFQALKGKTDLIVLPEMFTTGFSMETGKLAEPMDGPTMEWLNSMAAATGAAICGSFICAEKGNYYNRLVFMRPEGQFEHYDKRHLFSLGQEDQYFTAGRQRTIVEWQGWRICPLICYDLRFPVWSRNTPADQAYDLLLYVANWPTRRAHHWRSLLQARAIENQCFVAGVNVVGKDGNGLEYSGDSSLIDFSGRILVHLGDGQTAVETLELSLSEMQTFRQQLPFLADADAFEYT